MKILGKIKEFWSWLKADKRRLIIGIIVLLVAVAGSWKLVAGGRQKTAYQTATATRGTIVSSVSASGQILSSNFVNVSTQATGMVKTVYVKGGDRVYAGQAIAELTLDSDGEVASAKAWASLVSAQVALNAANNNYRSTQATLANVYDQIKGHDKDETFAQKETRTKAEVANDNAYDAIKSAQANLASAGITFRQVSPVIVAPVAGTVDNITITAGMVLSNSSSGAAVSSSRIAVVRSQGNPIATFNVSEVDVSRVKAGQKTTITLDATGGKTFTGKVLTIDKIGTISSGVTNYPVVISFDTQAPEILPNMAATANIIIESKSGVLLIPSEAVQEIGGASMVRVLRNGRAQEVAVKIGLSSDAQTEIVSGLSEGDVVVTGTSTGTRGGVSTSPFSTFRFGGGGGAVRLGR